MTCRNLPSAKPDGWGVFSPRLRCFKSWLPSWWRSWLPVHWCGLPALWSAEPMGELSWMVGIKGGVLNVWYILVLIYVEYIYIYIVVSPLSWGDILWIFDTFSKWHVWCYLVYIYIFKMNRWCHKPGARSFTTASCNSFPCVDSRRQHLARSCSTVRQQMTVVVPVQIMVIRST